MAHGRPTEFNETVQFKAPAGFSEALRVAARLEYTTVSEFLRRAVYLRLEKDKVADRDRPCAPL